MIVITAPTGQIGSELVRELLERGSELRVIARDASRLSDDARRRADVVVGSHGDPAVLDAALSGADAVFWLVPPHPAAPSTHEHYVSFSRIASQAISRHDVGHVVGVSSAGHGWAKPAGVLSSAFAMDAELRRSRAAYRALSMPFYMENLLRQVDSIVSRGSFSLAWGADVAMPTIATRDIARTAADLLADLSWSGQENLPVFGPDRLTPDQMAAVMGEELGRTIAYVPASIDDLVASLRSVNAPEGQITETVETFTAAQEGIYEADWAFATPTATDFRTWCREVLVPVAAARLP
ncbi:NAD(P)H-binding protein [Acidiferrimicrobium sp. IK]|uniref:NAD(P)H-binding protein n=1 Tax=Acidiferrimicrobium sp. IK TaxID=2871700 RepID=UPI0021CB370F|nr:NAD(P)H-binding protein [Acidiferrimicrobium sp. IK]MCU4183514.1 NAD(P)H-binding protein [Acidiferrimicrobium sp. IK]